MDNGHPKVCDKSGLCLNVLDIEIKQVIDQSVGILLNWLLIEFAQSLPLNLVSQLEKGVTVNVVHCIIRHEWEGVQTKTGKGSPFSVI
jgi:hypothetical protein